MAHRPDEGLVRLVVFHYHDRPGGVRQVISRGLPQLVRRLQGVEEVVLLIGELGDPRWLRELEFSLCGTPLRVVVHRNLGYLSGGPPEISVDAQMLVLAELSGKDVLVWAHNLSVGRNLPLLLCLPKWCAAAGALLWLHHHDWWWDGRWTRWADWQASGIYGLEEALALSVPTGEHIRHWCVNRCDLPWLQIRAGTAARWVGNPLPESTLPDEREIRQATRWLRDITGGRRVWLAPVRALRRKNLAEAILLAQHQAEPTCIVTTGGPSSKAEVPAWEFLCRAAVAQGWPFVPSVLAPGERISRGPSGKNLSSLPSLSALLTAAHAIVMPSLQEGFGLPYLEAAALGKPLLARALPEVSANLAALGCTLTTPYQSLPVPVGSFDAAGESIRLAARWDLVRPQLPPELRMDREVMPWSEGRDFGSLTLEAQLEVLQSRPDLPAPVPQPQVPCWPAGSRGEGWADRFFQDASIADFPLIDKGGQGARSAPTSLLPEVMRRFHYWQDHPLLWP